MSSKCLFIGGPKDGQRQMVLDFHQQLECIDRNPDPDARRPKKKKFYRSELFGANKDRHRVFILDSMTIEDALKMLLDGYRKL